MVQRGMATVPMLQDHVPMNDFTIQFIYDSSISIPIIMLRDSNPFHTFSLCEGG